MSGTLGNLLKPFERFLWLHRKPLKRFREFAYTVVTYLKIGVNKKRARQRELTLAISTSEEGPCKEGEKPKTAADNAALNRLITTLQSDINKLQQEASVLRRSRQLRAINNKIEKLKQMRAFWQQVAAVSCLPPGIPESVRSYLQERQARGDTADECSELCSATSAWIEQQTNASLQMKFSMDGCLASCK